MNFIQKLLKNMKDFVITVDPYDEEEEMAKTFTAEVNLELFQEMKNKDSEILRLEGIISDLCYRNMEALKEALEDLENKNTQP